MRRTLIQALIFFVLATNTAWLLDVHEAIAHEHTGAAMQVADHSGAGLGAGQQAYPVTCDHCCHGGGHYVGFPSAVLIHSFTCDPSAPAGLRAPSYISLIVEPPLQPPRVQPSL